MTQHYISTEMVLAWEQESGDEDGYSVMSPDGCVTWFPADEFESAYIGIGHVADYPAHVQRMIGEKAQLDDRLAKLQKFIASPAFHDQPPKSRELLNSQVGVMAEYSQLLQERLDLS